MSASISRKSFLDYNTSDTVFCLEVRAFDLVSFWIEVADSASFSVHDSATDSAYSLLY